MMDCKRASKNPDGEFDKAVELFRIKGAKDVGKREARTASNGPVVAHLEGSEHGVLLELNCETDFVATRLKDFRVLPPTFRASWRPTSQAMLLS